MDAKGTLFDGDSNGTPGGVYNYWFNAQAATNKTIFVDKIAPNGGTGTLASPYNTISTALGVAQRGDIVRIEGNNTSTTTLRQCAWTTATRSGPIRL